MRVISTLVLGSIILSGCAGMSQGGQSATAQLQPTQGNQANGTVSFTRQGDKLMLDARIAGLTPGQHGFHIHEKGDCSAPDAMSAGGHFNPSGTAHGGLEHALHHAGDFGNVTADASGNATLQASVPMSQAALDKGAANSIVGRAIVVHADPDDLKTQPTGNSGKRVACGVISLK